MNLIELLERNYRKIVDPECIPTIIEFVERTPSVQGRHPKFIKQVTKVARLILENHPEEIQHLSERLYQYAQEGALELQNGKDRNKYTAIHKEEHLDSHLSGTAAQFAWHAYKLSGNIGMAHNAYFCARDAAQGTKDEPMYSAQLFRLAAKAAREIALKNSSRTYTQNWLSAARNAATTAESAGHGDYSWSFWEELADAAKDAANILSRPELHEEAAAAYQKALGTQTGKKDGPDRRTKRLRALIEKSSGEFDALK